MSNYTLISSDSHIIEPPDLWEKRIAPKFKNRAPHLVHEEATDQWYVEDNLKCGALGVNIQGGERFESPENLTMDGKFEDVPLGAMDPHARIKDLELDTVFADVPYPSLGLSLYCVVQDSALFTAICQAYNDWLADYCSAYPNRIKGIAMLNVDDVHDGIQELQRAAKMGLVGAMIPTIPLEKQYNHPEYEPLWAAAQDLGMPLSLHISTHRATSPLATISQFTSPQKDTLRSGGMDMMVGLADRDVPVREAIAAMIFSGVFERYPKLMVGALEYEVAWAPYFVIEMDRVYEETAFGQLGERFQRGALPSDFFKRNVFISFQQDDLGMKLLSYFNVDNLMWGSDYPHAESTFPKSREIVDRIFQGVPEEAKLKIAGENTARLYHIQGL